MTAPIRDIIDYLAGIEPGSRLDKIRARRSEARVNAQESYCALFERPDEGSLKPVERFALASFVTGLHRQKETADFYSTQLAQAGHPAITDVISNEIACGRSSGPYGAYPAGPLSSENETGLIYAVSPQANKVLGDKLSAALDHAHLLVFRPRDSSPEALEKLLRAGWRTTDIVTLSQLVAFLSFQVRVVSGLRSLLATLKQTEAGHLASEFAIAAPSGRS